MHSYNGYYWAIKRTTDTCNNMDKSQNGYIEFKKSDKKRVYNYDSLYIKFSAPSTVPDAESQWVPTAYMHEWMNEWMELGRNGGESIPGIAKKLLRVLPTLLILQFDEARIVFINVKGWVGTPKPMPPPPGNMYTRYIPKFWKVSIKMHTVLIEDIQLRINSHDFHLEGIGKEGE